MQCSRNCQDNSQLNWCRCYRNISEAAWVLFLVCFERLINSYCVGAGMNHVKLMPCSLSCSFLWGVEGKFLLQINLIKLLFAHHWSGSMQIYIKTVRFVIWGLGFGMLNCGLPWLQPFQIIVFHGGSFCLKNEHVFCVCVCGGGVFALTLVPLRAV